MEHVIWKYTLRKGADQLTTIEVPLTHKILSVGVQEGSEGPEIVVWIEVRDRVDRVTKLLHVVYTGVGFNQFEIFIGTVQIDGLVYHILEVIQ